MTLNATPKAFIERNHQWLENDWERLERFSEILIFFDGDESGEKGAQEVVRRLGIDRCKRVKLPEKDANEFLQKGAIDQDFQEYIDKAQPMDPEEMRQASEFMSKVKSLFYPAHDDDHDPVLRLDKDLEWVEAVWKLKNFISISANESTDFLHFRMSKTFPAKNDLNPPNRAFKAFFALISPRKKGSSAHQTHRCHGSLKPKNAKHSLEVVGQHVQAHLGADIG